MMTDISLVMQPFWFYMLNSQQLGPVKFKMYIFAAAY
jgi:hypothetical protein